jgi:hypothetical protein
MRDQAAGRCPVKIRQREEGTLPLPVMDPADIEVLTRRVAALESITASLLWLAVARREPRRPE